MNPAPEPARISRVLVAGAGPAGMAAALACHAHGLSVQLVDPAPPGGLLRLSGWPMDATLGAGGVTGIEFAARMAADMERAGIARHPAAACGLDAAGRMLLLDGTPDHLPYDALIVATGVRFRAAGLPGEAEARDWFLNRPPLEPKPGAPGRHVLVIGGGDNAFSTALLEAETARAVTLVLRGQPHAEEHTILAAAQHPRIALRQGLTPLRIVSGPERRVEFAGPEGEVSIRCDAAYANLGYAPNVEWLNGALQLGPEGGIRVDGCFRASASRVWAVGEVTGLPAPCAQTGMGHGAAAARDVARALRDEAAVNAALATMAERSA